MSRHDWTPQGPLGLIRAAMANNQTRTVDFLTEFFDNSIDAGARNIEAHVGNVTKPGRGIFRIVDDGIGAASISHLMPLGESSKDVDGDKNIGRFGVGAKDCMFAVGGIPSTISIQSRTRDACWKIVIPWAEQREWLLEQDDCQPDDVDLETKTGLRIMMSKCYRKMVGATELRSHLSRVHWPWLEKVGNKMMVNGQQVHAPNVPRTGSELVGLDHVEVDPDKWFSVTGGLLMEESDLNGVAVVHGNRTLYVADAIGLCGVSRGGVFVLVRLHGKWSLSRNKEGLSVNDEEYLRAALEHVLAGLCEQARDKLLELHTDDSIDDMLEVINEQLAGAQVEVGTAARPGKGKPRKTPGPEREKKKRSKVQVSEVVNPGPEDVRERRRSRLEKPYKIEYATGDAEILGYADHKNRAIVLHKNNASVKMMRENREAKSILITGACLLASQIATSELPFPKLMGKLLHIILSGRSSELVKRG